MVARALVAGVSGVVRAVSFAAGLVSVVVESGGEVLVVRHKVGARGGIPLSESRVLWSRLKLAVGTSVCFWGRAGWDGWFDDFAFSPAPLPGYFEDEIAADLCAAAEEELENPLLVTKVALALHPLLKEYKEEEVFAAAEKLISAIRSE
jgi:hypothetical protein